MAPDQDRSPPLQGLDGKAPVAWEDTLQAPRHAAGTPSRSFGLQRAPLRRGAGVDAEDLGSAHCTGKVCIRHRGPGSEHR